VEKQLALKKIWNWK